MFPKFSDKPMFLLFIQKKQCGTLSYKLFLGFLKSETFIEADFPIKEVSASSVREKNIRHGHISTLHI